MSFFIREVADTYVQENFRQLDDILADDMFKRFNFKFFEFTVPGTVTNERRNHFLGFTPKDVLLSSSIGAGVITWNYSAFNAQYIEYSTTGPVTVRALIGRYEEK